MTEASIGPVETKLLAEVERLRASLASLEQERAELFQLASEGWTEAVRYAAARPGGVSAGGT